METCNEQRWSAMGTSVNMNLSIRDNLIQRGEQILAQPFTLLPFTGNAKADALLNDLCEEMV